MPDTTIAVPVSTLLRVQRKLALAVIFHLVGGLFLVALATGYFTSPAATGPAPLTPSQQNARDNLEHTNACLLGGNNKPADCPTTTLK